MTSLMPHKPINTLKARNHEFLRASYHGSIGRPDRSVKRRSAVELLQESKAYYVKSESVLDGRQELKNTDHFNVRSPTRVEVVSTLPRGGSHHKHGIPFSCYSVCPGCYPHSHTSSNKDHLLLDHFQLQTLQEHYLFHYEQLQRESREVFRACTQQSKVDRKLRRSSVPSPATFQLHAFQMERSAFPGFDHSTTSPFATVEKIASSAGRIPSQEFLSNSIPPSSKINQGFSSRADETPSPPPLPPKSPRTTTKPIRPHDFPQRLKSQGEGSPELPLIQPPPPPRRNSDQHVQDVHAKLRRLVRDRPSLKGRIQAHNQAITIPVTLPSPILPSTPPADVIMESPMSDSGPIISPPPAFSTPVTPMIDRQNSSASEKSNLSKIQLFPTSGSMSVVSAGSSSKSHKSVIGRGRNGNASISDISMRHSSKSPSGSESTSSPCPMSGGSPVAEETNGSADDDSSRKSPLLPPRPPIAKKYPSIPKSVTENTLYRVGSFESGTREQRNPTPIGIGTQTRHHSISSQTEGNPMGKLASPIRRPILRSKSDLSHRYKKSGSPHLLRGGGFTLVHVDLGASGSQEFSTASMDGRGRDSRRTSRSSVELERFFDMMGLENTDSPIASPPSVKSVPNGQRSSDSSPVFFSSVSSVDSTGRRDGSVESGDSPGQLQREQRYIGARTCGYVYSGGGPSSSQTTSSSLVVQHGEPSIVERNARVIKWLFNCRKTIENNRLRR